MMILFSTDICMYGTCHTQLDHLCVNKRVENVVTTLNTIKICG